MRSRRETNNKMSAMKTNVLLKRIGFLMLLLVVGVLTGLSAKRVFADATKSGLGFLWGGGVTVNPSGYDGMGWTSINNLSDGSIVNYGVNVPSVDGALSGQAWSDGYGWVSFDQADLAGCAPALSQATRTGNDVTGGARILSIRDGMTLGNAGGYDGCISLSGTATDGSPYGIKVAGTTLGGYAWSGDFGWIDFGHVTYTLPDVLTVCRDDFASPVARSDTQPSTGTSLSFGETRHLTAFYDTIPDCTGTDVTSSAIWTEQTVGGGAVTLSATGTNPKDITAKSSGSSEVENVTVSYPGASDHTLTVAANATCSATMTCSSEQDKYCVGQPFTIDNNGCGVAVNCTLTSEVGTRDCNTTFREVAP